MKQPTIGWNLQKKKNLELHKDFYNTVCELYMTYLQMTRKIIKEKEKKKKTSQLVM